MWRERIVETRKAKGITIKTMAERTPSHMSAEAITRILNEKTDDPRISTVLALGEAVGLSPWELFAETADLIAYQSFLTLQAEVDRLKAEVDELKAEKEALAAENEALKSDVADANSRAAALEIENDRLRLTSAHKDEVINLQKEIIGLHKSKTDAPNT
jgi:transcriptional regulator with XRE-family HTH domain